MPQCASPNTLCVQVVQKDAIPYDKQTGNLQTGVQFKLTDPSDVQPSVGLPTLASRGLPLFLQQHR